MISKKQHRSTNFWSECPRGIPIILFLTLPRSQLIDKLQKEKTLKERAVVTTSEKADSSSKAKSLSCAVSDAKKQEVIILTSQYDNAVLKVDSRRQELKNANTEAASVLKSFTDFQASFESEKATMSGFMTYLSGGMKCSASSGSPAEKAEDAPASCSAIYQAAKAAGKSVADGLYTIKTAAVPVPFQVYCDMSQAPGYTLVATVANGDAQQWTYNSADGDRGQMSSLWENGATLGSVSENTPSTNADFKSMAFNNLKGTSIMIKYKNSFMLSTNSGCISNSLHNTLNAYRFACGGSEDLSGGSAVCGHSCTIKRSESFNDPALLHGSSASYLYIKGKFLPCVWLYHCCMMVIV